jgi:putative hydroxymethylpyrimidine transport system ATP-binding protein
MYDSPDTDAPAVAVEAARLVYGGRPLFDGLDLALPAGRLTALLGPSGVGKSSLLRLIAGLEAAAEGRVHDGAGRPLAGRVAYMAQQDLLMPWLDLVGNATIGAKLRGERPDRARAARLLEELGLGGRLRDRPAALSGGMRQRVALARTLFEDRPVVLMDEPFSALDAITRHALQALAAEKLAGRTVLLVTHDPLEALRLGHEVRVMAGRPATLAAPLVPDGLPPRDPADAAVLRRHAELLDRLGRAHRAEEPAA